MHLSGGRVDSVLYMVVMLGSIQLSCAQATPIAQWGLVVINDAIHRLMYVGV